MIHIHHPRSMRRKLGTGGRADGRTSGRADGRTNQWIGGRTAGRTYIQTGRRADGRADSRKGGRTDEQGEETGRRGRKKQEKMKFKKLHK